MSRWTNAQKNKVIKSVDEIIVPKNTILYRAQPTTTHTIQCRTCEDTGKKGVYLSDGMNIPIGMILEYNKPMPIHVYKTTKELKFTYGKYSFRNLEPEHFYENYEDYKKNKHILHLYPKHSYSHIEKNIFPNTDIFDNKVWNHLDEKEYFIKDEDIKYLKHITSTGVVDITDAKTMLKDTMKKLRSKKKVKK